MGQGVDLGYYDIFVDPGDDDSPVWGYRRAGWWSRMSGDDRIAFVATAAFCLVAALLVGSILFVEGHNLPSFAVRLAGHDGIDPSSPGAVVSPAFGIMLRLNKTCVDRADVVVSYSGVALGWARAEPRDCAEKRWARDVEVVARGDGVGLSRRLRDRMALEWRSGALELDVDVDIFDDSARRRTDPGEFPKKVMSCKVKVQGQEGESSPCSWYSLGNLYAREGD
ncbi:hypothetical protein ACP70R_036685 [Stipagrostis hirtigluma subsp. patula]